MSTSNTSSLDQVQDPRVAAELREKRKQKISSSLAKRHRKEKMFRFLDSLLSLLVCSSSFCYLAVS